MSLRDIAGQEGARGGARLRALRATLRDRWLARGEGGRTGRNAVLAFAIRVAGAGLAYASQALLARWMGSFEYGIFVFVWVWVLILGGLAPLGLSTVAIRFVPEYRETGRISRLRGLLLGSRGVALAVGTAFMLASLAFLWAFSDALEEYYWLPAFIILFCLPVYALVDVQDGIARGYSWIDVALSPVYLLRPVLLLLAMGAAALMALPLTAVTAAACAVFAYWLSGIVQTLVLERRIAANTPPGKKSYDFRLWMTTALPLVLVLGFELLLQNTDILILSRYLGPSDVAIYFAALKTMGLVSFVHFAVGTAAANRFSALNALGESEQLGHAAREAVRWTFWPSLAGVVVLLALGQPLLRLFGEDFGSGYPVMFILACGFLLRAATGPADYILNMLGQQKICAAVLSLSAALNIALNFTLIPLYGLHGAAVATSASIAFASVTLWLVARRRLGLELVFWARDAREKS